MGGSRLPVPQRLSPRGRQKPRLRGEGCLHRPEGVPGAVTSKKVSLSKRGQSKPSGAAAALNKLLPQRGPRLLRNNFRPGGPRVRETRRPGGHVGARARAHAHTACWGAQVAALRDVSCGLFHASQSRGPSHLREKEIQSFCVIP